MSSPPNSTREYIINGLNAGVIIGVTEVIFAISLGALIFAGQTTYVANGIGLILLGAIISIIFVSFFSSYHGTQSVPQDAPAAILAVMAASMLQNISLSAPREKFITVVAAIVLTSLLTGIVFIVMGYFKLGSLVRFLPYPVVGGFLAGTGWLLVIGGIGIMADVSFSFSDPGALFQAGLLLKWFPGLVLAFIMLFTLNRYEHFLVLPGLLAGIAVLFYVIAFVTGTSIATLSEQGWLLGPFVAGSLLQPMSLADISLIHWDLIFRESGSIASIIILSMVSLLLNASGLELIVRKDLDLNRELRVAGLGNVFAGIFGSSVSYHALSTTTLNHRIGKGSPISSLVVAVFFTLPLFIGVATLSYIPKVLLASLLILFGLSFLYEWVYLAWFRFSKLEYVVILLILASIATLGYLQGVAIGIVAAVVLFVINYSRISVTRHTLSGSELQSRFIRSPRQKKALVDHGGKTFILQLQGYIFFGTASKLLEQVRGRIELADEAVLQFVVLDFSRVSGLDSTAMLSFSKMKQILQDRGISLLITGLSEDISKRFETGGIISNASSTVIAFPNLDHGLEWVEEKILLSLGEEPEPPLSLKEMFYQVLPAEDQLNGLFHFLEKREVEQGDYLMRQDDAPDDIYFVESGQVTARLEFASQAPVRLETMRSGRVIGEIGFYLGQQRTAAVVADQPSVVYSLSAQNLARMEKEAPDVASYFHQLIILLLAERTTHLIRTVAALEK